MKNELYIGQKVYWNDPDDNLCSGYKTITKIEENTIILDNGTEALISEISTEKPS